MDIGKAFDTLDHSFLILVLKNFGVDQNFINWIETLLKDQKSCIVNVGKATPYFTLHRGARQGDTNSVFLFFSLSIYPVFRNFVPFNLKKSVIQGIEIFDHC